MWVELIYEVFTSPKIVILRSFNKDVLWYSSYFAILCLLAIDELHLITEWHEFWSDYFALGIFQTHLSLGIPFLKASATLNKIILKTVKEAYIFDSNIKIIKTPLDRPEIYIQINKTIMSISGMADLQEVLPAQIKRSINILKIIIFINLIVDIKKMCILLCTWMKQLNYLLDSSKWVALFFSDIASDNKEILIMRFDRLSEDCEWPQILIATDIYNLDINNLNIKRVWQWLLPLLIQKIY